MLGLVSPFATTITGPCKHTQDSPCESRIDCVCSYVFYSTGKVFVFFLSYFSIFIFFFLLFSGLLIILYHTNKLNEHFVLLI